MELNSVPVIDSLDSGNFTIKFNKTELYALSGTNNSYNSLYRRCLLFLVYWYIYFCRYSSTVFLMCGK